MDWCLKPSRNFGAQVTPLEWELNWIDNNPQRYEGPMHIEAVKRFITERYRFNAIEKALKERHDINPNGLLLCSTHLGDNSLHSCVHYQQFH